MEAEGAGATWQGRPGEQPWKRPTEVGGEGAGRAGRAEGDLWGCVLLGVCQPAPHLVLGPRRGLPSSRGRSELERGPSRNRRLDLASVPRVARALC